MKFDEKMKLRLTTAKPRIEEDGERMAFVFQGVGIGTKQLENTYSDCVSGRAAGAKPEIGKISEKAQFALCCKNSKISNWPFTF